MHPLIRRVLANLIAASATLAAFSPALAQSFTNLNFESGLRDQPLGGMYTLPGWTVSPSFQQPHIGTVHVLYPSAAVPEWQPFFPPNGNQYSLTMQVGMGFPDFPQGILLVSSISQTALIPANAKSVRFRATTPDPYFRPSYGPPLPPALPDVYSTNSLLAWNIAIDGQRYPLYRLGDEMWGMNIPGHAGQVRTLSITMNPNYKFAPPQDWWPESRFDDITFSSQRIVPEPTAAAFAVTAVAAAAILRRSRNDRQAQLSPLQQ
jgi:hypothetical protein